MGGVRVSKQHHFFNHLRVIYCFYLVLQHARFTSEARLAYCVKNDLRLALASLLFQTA